MTDKKSPDLPVTSNRRRLEIMKKIIDVDTPITDEDRELIEAGVHVTPIQEADIDEPLPEDPEVSARDMQNMAFASELVRCYNEVETATRMLFLAAAGKHPLSISIWAQTLAMYQTMDESWEHFIGPMLEQVRPGGIPPQLLMAGKVWRICHTIMGKLKVGHEIMEFVTKHHTATASDNPMHPINKMTDRQKANIKNIHQLAADQAEGKEVDAPDLPDWGFSTKPSSPLTAHPKDPCWGTTDVTTFSHLIVDTLTALRILCDSKCTLEDANEIMVQYMNVWNRRSKKRARRKKKKASSRTATGKHRNTRC